MKITQQTASLLIIKAGARTRLLWLGLGCLVVGMLAIGAVRLNPATPTELSLPDLLQSQQRMPSATEQTIQTSSPTGFGGLSLAQYVGKLLFTGWQGVALIGILAMMGGLLILLGPHYHQVISLDKATQTLTIKQSRWWLRTRVETYPFRDIAEIRVERDRETGRRAAKNYRGVLVISHSEGIPLSRDYVHYTTICPISAAYRYSYQHVQNLVDRVQGFLSA
ncbi:MAG: hypothetical protein AB1801_09560 [Chloroflexota bacterium]